MRASASTEGDVGARRYWHHDLHEAWAHRRLYFWLFQFSELYPRDAVLSELKRIAADNDITSYASYELLGEWDLLARLYVDPFQRKRFHSDVAERLAQYAFRDQRWLEVEDVVRHWVWAAGRRRTGEPRRPSRRDLERLWPRSELRVINDFAPPRRETALIRKYKKARLLSVVPHGSGMKLAIAIQRRGPAPDEYQYDRTKADLARLLDDMGPWLQERSLYACGRDSDTPFMLMCRFPNERYGHVRFDLLQPIGDAVRPLNARVTTYPIVSEDFICFEDRLPPVVVQPAPGDVKTLLEGPETLEFEVKGSALAPLDNWLKKGALLEENPAFCADTICREIVGFLNSGGGALVIGALETKRYGRSPALADYARNEYNIICGIPDPTFVTRGWDVWERKMRDLITAHIVPRLTSEVQLRRVLYGDAVLCLIAIDEVEPDYFLRPANGSRQFVARVGTSAVHMGGHEMERHCKTMRDRVRRRRRYGTL